MIYFHSRRYNSLSLFEESSKDSNIESTPVKRGRGRPPKLKAVTSTISEKSDLMKEELMSASVVYERESHHEPVKEVENIVTLSPAEEETLAEEGNPELNWESGQNNSFEMDEEDQHFDESYEEEFCEEDAQSTPEIRDFSQNSVALNFSWSLMNQLRQMSKMEGIAVEDLLVELVAEGVAKRVFEDQMRPAPSHLMTRTGYVHSDGTQAAPQPHLSHHMMNNNNRQQPNNIQNRNRFSFQQRNPQHQQQNNNNRSPANHNRNYQQNNNPRQSNNNQNGFRNQYTNNNNSNNMQQQRFNSRPNYQNSQKFYEEQSSSSQQTGNQYRQQRDTNKR